MTTRKLHGAALAAHNRKKSLTIRRARPEEHRTGAARRAGVCQHPPIAHVKLGNGVTWCASCGSLRARAWTDAYKRRLRADGWLHPSRR